MVSGQSIEPVTCRLLDPAHGILILWTYPWKQSVSVESSDKSIPRERANLRGKPHIHFYVLEIYARNCPFDNAKIVFPENGLSLSFIATF